jgi:di/tricarboxylate transporter
VSDSTITFLILAVVVAVFVWDRLPVEIVAVGTALSLWATVVLDYEQGFAGFGDPTVIFIASLFVVSEGLEAAGVTSWARQELIARIRREPHTPHRPHDAAGSRAHRADQRQRLGGSPSAGGGRNGRGLGRPSSQLLMPLVFGAHAGSLLLLTGTPVNVIASDKAAAAGVGRFGFFEFALVGVPLVAGTIVVVVFFGEHLLPYQRAAMWSSG